MSGGSTYGVFLSYSRGDEALAMQLDRWLKSQGLCTFFDRLELAAGLPWITGLENAIARSDSIAILIGPRGIGNTQQYEVELALVRHAADRSFPVIPVLLPGCENPPVGFLQLMTWVDLRASRSLLDRPDQLQSLLAAIHRQHVTSAAIRGSICPYMGLEAFQEEDAAFYCGRDTAVADLLAKVRDFTFVAVIGRSGSGKSSLVNAGLLPALRRQYRASVWDVVSLKPGPSPLHALAAAFNADGVAGGVFSVDAKLEDEVATLRQGSADKLHRVITQRLAIAPEKPDRLLIHVDQWEELYSRLTLNESDEKRRLHEVDVARFIDLLLAATSADAGGRTRVVVTVRADFYGPLIRHPDVSRLLPRQQVNLGPMTRNDLRSPIVTPAEKVGLRFSPPALVDRILDDVGRDERMLPLLQYALKETWFRRKDDTLTAEGYAATGGVREAIQSTAERTYAALTPAEQAAAQRLFLGLVTPGEGEEDTRARTIIPEDPLLLGVVEKFADRKARLLVTGSEAVLGEGEGKIRIRPTVEIAHEALIRSWPMLRGWLEMNREKLRLRAAILEDMRQWENNGRRDDLLLQGGFQLERGRTLLADPGAVPVEDLRSFIEASIARDQLLVRDREEQEQRELRRELEHQRARARSRSLMIYVIGAALVIFTASAVVAWWQVRAAARAEDEARARQIWSRLEFADWQNGVLSRGDLDALWDLATSGVSIRQRFVAEIALDPTTYLTRFIRRPLLIGTALRLPRGAPETDELLKVLVEALRRGEPNQTIVGSIMAVMAGRWTPEQADRGFEELLTSIGPMLHAQDVASLPAKNRIQQTIWIESALDGLGRRVSDDLASHALQRAVLDLKDDKEPARWLQGVALAAASRPSPDEAARALGWCVDTLRSTGNRYRQGLLVEAIWILSSRLDVSKTADAFDAIALALDRFIADNGIATFSVDQVYVSTDTDVDIVAPAEHAADLADAEATLAARLNAEQAATRLGPTIDLLQELGYFPAAEKLSHAALALVARLNVEQAAHALPGVLADIRKPRKVGLSYQIDFLAAIARALADKLPPDDITPMLTPLITAASAATRVENSAPALLSRKSGARDAKPPASRRGAPQPSELSPAPPPPPPLPLPVYVPDFDLAVLAAATLAERAPSPAADDVLAVILRANLQDVFGSRPEVVSAINMLASRLSDPSTTFDAMLQEVTSQDFRTDKIWSSQVAAALADSLPPARASARLATILNVLESGSQYGPDEALTKCAISLAAKLDEPNATAALDRVIADLRKARRVGATHGDLAAARESLPGAARADDIPPLNGSFLPWEAYARTATGLAARVGAQAAASRLDSMLELIPELPPQVSDSLAANNFTPTQAASWTAVALGQHVAALQAARLLDRIRASMTQPLPWEQRLAYATIASTLIERLADSDRSRFKVMGLYALQRSENPFETDAWAHALVHIFGAEPLEIQVKDIVEVLKYPNAADRTAGPLLQHLHEILPDAPGPDAGIGGNLDWIAQHYRSIDLTAPPLWLTAPDGAPPGL